MFVCLFGLLLLAGTIYAVTRVVNQSEEHIEEIKSIHVAGTRGSDNKLKESEADRAFRLEINKSLSAERLSADYYELTDDSLARLEQMKRLKDLSLGFTRVSDRGIEHIARLPLVKLNLTETRITDKGLEDIARIKSLTVLNLGSTAITDEGMRYLKTMENLNNLNISNAKISDKGIATIAPALKHLRHLNIANTFATRNCLSSLARMKGLATLIIDGTEIRGEDLDCLAGKLDLESLCMENCHVTDGDIKLFVERFPHLVHLNISGTRVSDEGIKSLESLANLRLLQIRRMPDLSKQALDRLKKGKPALTIDQGLANFDNIFK
ncbi:MAG: hypothetical protein AB7W16_15465 [Candidatus Obscuribacterales bacterium]